jgi:hypothetical protein
MNYGKVIGTLIICLLLGSTAHAQKIKIKKGEIFIDDVLRFTIVRKVVLTQISIYNLSEDEILFIHRKNNETPKYADDDFIQMTFIKNNRKLESSSMDGRTVKWILKNLLEEKVLNLEGIIDSDKLDLYFTKHDEQITERTVR